MFSKYTAFGLSDTTVQMRILTVPQFFTQTLCICMYFFLQKILMNQHCLLSSTGNRKGLYRPALISGLSLVLKKTSTKML